MCKMARKMYLSFIFCFCILSSLKCVLSNPLPDYELNILHDLYSSTQGETWSYSSGKVHWNFSSPNPSPCDEHWDGITCIRDPYNSSLSLVYNLALGSHNLNGTIPESIGNLSLLVKLQLLDNYLYGTVPSTITNLVKLTTLDLSGTKVNGTIPHDIGRLTSISTLNFIMTEMTGTLPDSLGDMVQCTHLYLSFCHFSGTIPDSLGLLNYMRIMDLSQNQLNGTIPDKLFNKNSLYFLALTLDMNQLTGSIPEVIDNLPALSIFTAYWNQLTGRIPSTIGNNTMLSMLDVDNNFLTGSLPDSLCSLKYLMYLRLNDNKFTSSIPQCIGNSAGGKLQEFSIENNHFNGSIPDSFYSLYTLQRFTAGNNHLSGSLSPLFGQLRSLKAFDITDNNLEGSLPETVGNCSFLDTLTITGNYFTSSLPFSLGNLTKFKTLFAQNNHLSGVIPESYSHITTLTTFELSTNLLTGTIPSLFGQNMNLVRLYLDNNAFEGSVPATVWSNPHINWLSLNNNYFSGTVVDNFPTSDKNMMIYFVISNNYFTGTLPQSFAHFTSVLQLQIDSNLFQGTLSSSLSVLPALQTLFVNNNLLRGSLDSAFNASIQTKLLNIDVSSNQFTGALPTQPFLISTLQSFAVVRNCFSGGSPPAEMCAAQNLITLALDGLMSGSTCEHSFFTATTGIHSYWLDRSMSGGVPSCLFVLPKLSILHLSGNGFTSTLPSSLSIAQSLSDLSLSNNILRGAIPSVIQSRVWTNLDLSFNKLGGTLSGSDSLFPPLGSNASLSLQVNRLSGEVPSALRDAEQISILDGNLFGCDANRDSLPVNDPDSRNYECGSNTFNYSMYVWVAVIFCAVLIVVIAVLLPSVDHKSVVDTCCQYMSVFDRSDGSHITLLGRFLSDYRMLCLFVSLFALLVMLPVNGALTSYFNTYTHEYAWILSSAYLSGVIPTFVLLVCFAILCFGCLSFVMHRLCRDNSHTQTANDNRQRDSWTTSQYCFLTVFIVFNVCLMVGVNIAYVFIHNNYSSNVVQVTQMCIAVFKTMWNKYAVRGILRLSEHFLESGLYSEKDGVTVNTHIGVAVFVILFNNLAAPFLATAFVSSNCFYNVITTPPSVVVSYLYSSCVQYLVDPITYETYCSSYTYGTDPRETSYVPPFSYSYQCSSTFITTYSSVYVFMLIIAAVVTPLTRCVLLYVASSLRTDSFCYKQVRALLPKILKPHRSTTNCNHDHEQNSLRPNNHKLIKLINSTFASRLFDCDVFIVQLVNFLAVLVTFGVVFPPLAVVALVAIYSFTYTSQLYVGCFMLSGTLTSAKHSLDTDCSGARDMFLKSLWIVAPFAVLFYSFLLFDTLGDEVGYKRAMWLPLSIIGVSVLIWLCGHCRWCSFTTNENVRHSLRSWSGAGAIELDPDATGRHSTLTERLLDVVADK